MRLELATPETLAEGTRVEMFGQEWHVLEVLEEASGGRSGFVVCSPEPQDPQEVEVLP